MRANENFWFLAVEQKILFNRSKKCSRDLNLMFGDEFKV